MSSKHNLPACYMCGCSLQGAALSAEHVIPNALGGRWKSCELLCRACNSTCGARIDAALAREIGVAMNLLSLERASGDVQNAPVMLSSGEQLLRDIRGNMWLRHALVREETQGDQITVEVRGGRRRDVHRAIQGLARKYPGKIDVDAWIAKMNETRTLAVNTTHFTFKGVGSNDSLRSIAKIAANVFVLNGGARQEITRAASYIRGDHADHTTRWYYTSDPFKSRDARWVTHAVALRVDAESRSLWAYVELFRVFRYAVRLSTEFSGPLASEDYVYELCNQIRLDVPRLDFDPRGLDVADGGVNMTALQAELSHLKRLAEERSLEVAIAEVVDSAFEAALARGPNATMHELLPGMMEELDPILQAIARRR